MFRVTFIAFFKRTHLQKKKKTIKIGGDIKKFQKLGRGRFWTPYISITVIEVMMLVAYNVEFFVPQKYMIYLLSYYRLIEKLFSVW